MMNETIYLFAISSPDILERLVERVQIPPHAAPAALTACPRVLHAPPEGH